MSANTPHKAPHQAFILAAGFGTRLRPLTETRPKPLVEIHGRSMLARTLDQLGAVGVDDVVINAHYLGQQIEAFAHEYRAAHPDIAITVSHEDPILDTGGGIKKMISHFDDAFYVLSGDGHWSNGQTPALQRLADNWNDDEMDILMLLQPVKSMDVTKGVGDYHLDDQGRAIRALDQSGDHMFTSIRINHPRIFDGAPDGAFSYLQLMDSAQEAGRLHGLLHDAHWYHISTPADLEATEAHDRD